jgi:uncharacterized protein
VGQPASARRFPDPVAPEFAAFFAGLAQGRLTVWACTSCGALVWPPRPVCPRCRAGEFRPAPVSGLATVHTFTVCQRGFDPWFAGRVPYAIVVADVSDGIRLTGNYLGDPSELRCGLPVRARGQSDGARSWLGWEPVAGGLAGDGGAAGYGRDGDGGGA